ncbi:hypothetical protein D3C76_1614470 [compost metagenome]
MPDLPGAFIRCGELVGGQGIAKRVGVGANLDETIVTADLLVAQVEGMAAALR